jgi:hypothetical protein
LCNTERKGDALERQKNAMAEVTAESRCAGAALQRTRAGASLRDVLSGVMRFVGDPSSLVVLHILIERQRISILKNHHHQRVILLLIFARDASYLEGARIARNATLSWESGLSI